MVFIFGPLHQNVEINRFGQFAGFFIFEIELPHQIFYIIARLLDLKSNFRSFGPSNSVAVLVCSLCQRFNDDSR